MTDIVLVFGFIFLLRFEFGINAKKACDTTNIVSSWKTPQKIHNSSGLRSGSNIQQNTKFRLEISTEPFKEPQMWW